MSVVDALSNSLLRVSLASPSPSSYPPSPSVLSPHLRLPLSPSLPLSLSPSTSVCFLQHLLNCLWTTISKRKWIPETRNRIQRSREICTQKSIRQTRWPLVDSFPRNVCCCCCCCCSCCCCCCCCSWCCCCCSWCCCCCSWCCCCCSCCCCCCCCCSDFGKYFELIS